MVFRLDKEQLGAFTSAEKSVVDFINKNETEILSMSITEIAERTFTSPATVSRAVRKCGISGISELRFKISSKASDPAPMIVNNILQRAYEECTKTIEKLNVTDILRTADLIRTAKKIYVVGRGTTAYVAREFVFQLQLQGYVAFDIDDSELLKQMDHLISNEDLLMIFSVHNTTAELTTACSLAAKAGAKVIVCCCKSGTSLEEYADISIIGYEHLITLNEVFGCTSRLPLQIVARTLIECLML